jgi:hypothetical protein
MPNCCFNTLVVNGSNTELKKFLVENQSSDDSNTISFEKMLPVPVGTKNVREWCIQQWGTLPTNAEMYSSMSKNSDTNVSFEFETAWTPPDAWVIFIGKKYPSLKFNLYYDEPNCRFRGYIEVNGGKVITQNHESDYESDDDGYDSV